MKIKNISDQIRARLAQFHAALRAAVDDLERGQSLRPAVDDPAQAQAQRKPARKSPRQNAADALRAAVDDVRAGRPLRVSISNGNSKMGRVPSVSMLPLVTCPADCLTTCAGRCYAAKLALLRPNVLRAWAVNTALAIYEPAIYWAAIDAAAKTSRFFRYHVSGDILNTSYFLHMIETARRNPGTRFLAFTKRFEVVNSWIDDNGPLPDNLKILFSGWPGLAMDNPHGLPETIVIPTGEEPDPEWLICGGNCESCACRGLGCWQAQSGDVIAFHMH